MGGFNPNFWRSNYNGAQSKQSDSLQNTFHTYIYYHRYHVYMYIIIIYIYIKIFYAMCKIPYIKYIITSEFHTVLF